MAYRGVVMTFFVVLFAFITCVFLANGFAYSMGYHQGCYDLLLKMKPFHDKMENSECLDPKFFEVLREYNKFLVGAHPDKMEKPRMSAKIFDYLIGKFK